MERRKFLKDTLLTGLVISAPRLIKAASPKKGDTGFLKILSNERTPQFSFFSIDSLGKNNLKANIILHDTSITQVYATAINKNKTSYFLPAQKSKSEAAWQTVIYDNSFTITSHFNEGAAQPFVLNFNQHENHATLLGIMKGGDGQVTLPAILHFPDMGTLRLTCNVPEATVLYSSQRFIEFPFVKIQLPAATATSPVIEYNFQVVTIHPQVKGIENDDRYDCFRKNFISILQLNPLLKILANNSASDACAFTLFEYAEAARYMPPLANGLSAFDLVRMTLDRYLAGQKGYGLPGYDYDKTWDIPENATTCATLDSYPSLLIAACTYALGNKDKGWFKQNYTLIKQWSDKMLAADSDNDGLLEFCLSGNSGSWRGDKKQRPANWWDTIGFGHKDAYSNALAYRALILLEEANHQYGTESEALFFKEKAKKLSAVYTSTFYNSDTGILAGWKSADGKLHDYYFTFVNAMAISYGLIETSLANGIMDKLLQKMKAVGYQNFELGLPGNLVPVIRADYTDLLPEVGGGKREDNLDGFQIYENGGATSCFVYFTIHALQSLGRKEDADTLLLPLLKSMSEGNFQGRCKNGRTKDWKTWTGECWGYEGFLVDNYMFLIAVAESGSLYIK